MTENEFLLYLNTLTISEEYDDGYYKNLFQALFMFFEPDINCIIKSHKYFKVKMS